MYGDFHVLRTFHTDLFQSISRSDALPYPALDTLFDQLFVEANFAVGARVNYDTTYWAIQRATEGKKNIIVKEPFASLEKQFEAMPDSLPR